MWYIVVFQPSKCRNTHFQLQIWSIWPIFPNDSESLLYKTKKLRNSEPVEVSAPGTAQANFKLQAKLFPFTMKKTIIDRLVLQVYWIWTRHSCSPCREREQDSLRTFQYDSKKNNLAHSLDDSDLVGDVQGVVVRGKADVGLLISSGSHQCVHL